ncbi:hypothetical protein [uncultured Pseudodesulfovibrio sp.]|uniref:alpha/beta hydrolase n=1 Tax=uncultured Pseudodesulfovibrio sp. TaxID=2035858 RepID=UPI0029C81736|nr:hypothetical protein [uncultured Pseudodesulfovibrio sp.]
MKELLLFIHGLGGNADSTWGSFKDLLSDDEDIRKRYDIAFFEYRTSIGLKFWIRGAPGQVLADALKSEIELRYSTYERITIVAHSLGGLIAKRFILDRLKYDQRLPVFRILFYATPHSGSQLASIAKYVSFMNRHLKQLCKKSDFVDLLNREWAQIDSSGVKKLYCIGGDDAIVSPRNAAENWGNNYITVGNKGHRSLVKPTSHDDLSYIALKKFICGDPESLKRAHSSLDALSKSKIEKDVVNSKYIREVFVETSDVKEYARWFVRPELFYSKMLKTIKGYSSLARYLSLINVEGFKTIVAPPPPAKTTIGEVVAGCEELEAAYRSNIELLSNLESISFRDVESKLEIPEEQRYYAIHLNPDFYPKYTVSTMEKQVEPISLFRKNTFLLTSPAGHGKTNFICDFIETVCFKRSIPCACFSGNDFDGDSDIQETISNELAKYDYDLLEFADDYYSQYQKYTVVAIDGLNESRNIERLGAKLERFLKVIAGTNVKCILTCRCEYFENRFNQLTSGPLASGIFVYDDIVAKTTDRAKDKLLRGYLRHFNIQVDALTNYVHKVLSSDPLLLRFFCESYKGTQENITVLHRLYHLHREEIFRLYFQNKIDSVKSLSGAEPFINTKVNDIIFTIADYMIYNGVYEAIQISQLGFSSEQLDALARIVDEDIVLRRDIRISKTNSERVPMEVIGFTFDEFRDYIISLRLHDSIRDQDPDCFERHLALLDDQNTQIIEGVGRYLFYIIKQSSDSELIDHISQKEWYKRVLYHEFMVIEDRLLNSRDLEYLVSGFKYKRLAADILFNAISRYDSTTYENYNLQFVVESLLSLNGKQRYSVTADNVFEKRDRRIHYHEKQYIHPDFFKNEIDELISFDTFLQDRNLVLFILILYLSAPFRFGSLFRYLSHLLKNNPELFINSAVELAERDGGSYFTVRVNSDLIGRIFHEDDLTTIVAKCLEEMSEKLVRPSQALVCFEYNFEYLISLEERSYGLLPR